MPWSKKQLWLTLTYYHLVLPHGSLRQQLDMREFVVGEWLDSACRTLVQSSADVHQES